MESSISFSDPEELRGRLEALGYEVISEKFIQDGYQFRCTGDVIASWYETGVTLPQGKNGHVLRRQLSGEAGEPTLYAQNRVFIIRGEMAEEAECIAEQLALQYGLDPILIPMSSLSDGSFEQFQRQHQRFAQFGVVVGRRSEFLDLVELKQAAHDVVTMFGRVRLVVVVDVPLRPMEINVPLVTPIYSLDSLDLDTVVAFCADRMFLSVNNQLRGLMKSHFERQQSPPRTLNRSKTITSVERVDEDEDEDDEEGDDESSPPWQ